MSLSSPGLLSDQDYLDRLGFIPSDQPDRVLPIGFEHGSAMVDPTTGSHWKNPETGNDLTRVGLTCAACHTGRMTYKGTSLLVDGGSALIDIESVRKAMGVSLLLTRYMPFRFDRFADRVIGRKLTEDERWDLVEYMKTL